MSKHGLYFEDNAEVIEIFCVFFGFVVFDQTLHVCVITHVGRESETRS